MSCTFCKSGRCQPVTLVGGDVACTYSELWRFECECRHVLNMPTLQARREYLYGVAETKFGRTAFYGGLVHRRGEAGLKKVEAMMTALWEARQKDRAI